MDLNFYAAFEEAITTYGNEVYAYKVADNLLTYEGNPTTIQPGNEELVEPNLKKELNEINLLNAKLLYTNSCFF